MTPTSPPVPLDDRLIAQQVRRFASVLWHPSDLVEVRGVEGPSGEARTLLFCVAADLPKYVDRLRVANAAGINIYAGINPRRSCGRGDTNVRHARSLFVDFERTDAASALAHVSALQLPPPSLVLNSGHGIHTYWALAEPVGPAVWREFQHDLAALLGSDPTVRNPERLARLPGFLNTKNAPSVLCQLLAAHVERRYDLADLPIPMRSGSDNRAPLYRLRHVTEQERSGDPVPQCIAYLSKCPNAISGSGGHMTTWHAANTCNRFGLPHDEALDVMRWYSGAKCDPPWSEREILHKVKDAYQRNQHQHGQMVQRAAHEPKRLYTIRIARGAA